MINPVQCGTCKPQSLNIQRPQGPKATSFGNAGKVLEGAAEAVKDAAPDVMKKAPGFFKTIASQVGKLFRGIAKNAGKIGTTIKEGVQKIFTTEGKGFQKLWANVKGLVDSAIGFINKNKEKVGDAAEKVVEVVK